MATGENHHDKIRIVSEGTYIPGAHKFEIREMGDKSGTALKNPATGERILILGQTPGNAHVLAAKTIEKGIAVDERTTPHFTRSESWWPGELNPDGKREPTYHPIGMSVQKRLQLNVNDSKEFHPPLTVYTGVQSEAAYQAKRAYEQHYLGDGPTHVASSASSGWNRDHPSTRKNSAGGSLNSSLSINQAMLDHYKAKDDIPAVKFSGVLKTLADNLAKLATPHPTAPHSMNVNLVHAPVTVNNIDKSVNVLTIRSRSGGNRGMPVNETLLAALPRAGAAIGQAINAQNHEGRVATAVEMMGRSIAMANLSQTAAMAETGKNLSLAVQAATKEHRVMLYTDKRETRSFDAPRPGVIRALFGETIGRMFRIDRQSSAKYDGPAPRSNVRMIMPDFTTKVTPSVIASSAVTGMSFNQKDKFDTTPDIRGQSKGDTAMFEGRGIVIGVAASMVDTINHAGWESSGGGVSMDSGSASFDFGDSWG